jgi:hypothetical protein
MRPGQSAMAFDQLRIPGEPPVTHQFGELEAETEIPIESFEPDPAKHDAETQSYLQPLISMARVIAQIEARVDRTEADVIT